MQASEAGSPNEYSVSFAAPSKTGTVDRTCSFICTHSDSSTLRRRQGAPGEVSRALDPEGLGVESAVPTVTSEAPTTTETTRAAAIPARATFFVRLTG